MRNRCKYGIIERGVLSASGHDELIAAFEFKKDATAYFNRTYTKNQRRIMYRVVRLPEGKA